jgi:hypothetical protein
MLFAACSGSTPNGPGNTAGISGAWDAAASNNGSAGTAGKTIDGVGDSCANEGETRTCCGTGTQVCSGTVEFKAFGPCLDASGQQITCTTPNDPGMCGVGEFAKYCGVNDAGTNYACGDGEFGPNCVPSTPDSGLPVCGPGEFGPTCAGDGGIPPMPKLCDDRSINNEPEILAGYSPAMNQTVSQNGQIKVWVTDECPLLVAPDEQIDATTGVVMKAGDRSAVAEDNFLLEPALYIAPASAESGGTPHFPQYIKGWHNNVRPPFVPYRCRNDPNLMAVEVPGIDAPPPGASLSEMYDSEVIWDVKSLGLKPGTYTGEFLIHDGDHDRGIGCVTITVTD